MKLKNKTKPKKSTGQITKGNYYSKEKSGSAIGKLKS
jgi:hypothetical protein